MPLQEIITYIIVALAGMKTLYSFYRTMFHGKQNRNLGGCSSNCTCDAEKLRKELLIKVRK